MGLILLLMVVNTPVYLMIGRLLFGGWEGFFTSLKWCLTPDILSWFKGDYVEDRWGEMVMSVFLILCGLLTFAEFDVLTRVFHVSVS